MRVNPIFQSHLDKHQIYALYTYMKILWDQHKARSNRKKHGVGFPDAEVVFFDPNAITLDDVYVRGEQRFVSLGLDSVGRVLVVAYSYRDDDIRLISARKATRNERRHYEERI